MGRVVLFLMVMLAARSAVAATIDVTTFGATPNGGADDAAAINAAINAAQTRDTVHIPAGVYDVSAVVFAKSNVAITGAGQASTSLRYAGNAPIVILDLENVTNVNVSNLTCDGNNASKLVQGIYAKNSSYLTLENLTVTNLGNKDGFGPHGILCHANVTHSTIQNNTITNAGTASNWGAGIRLGDGSAFNKVLTNTISNTGRGGILCSNGSSDLVIKNNIVTGSGGTGLGIELQGGCDRSVIEGNQIDHWLSIDDSDRVAVRRNVISDTTGVHKWAGIELVDSSDNVFTDNVVDRGARLGISISGPDAKERVLWTRNAIKTASTWGIQIQGEAGLASKQYFYKNSFQFTIRNGPETSFPPQGHGVRFNGNASDIVFDSNLIDANLGHGVQLSGGNLNDLSFIRNRITGNTLNALSSSGATNLTWLDNDVFGNGNNTQPAAPAGLRSEVSSIAIAVDDDVSVGKAAQFSIGLLGSRDELAAMINEPIMNVLWDFGDGLPSTEFQPAHLYEVEGAYLVTLVAWDADGNAQLDQVTVTVVPEPGAIGLVLVGVVGSACRRGSRRRLHCGALFPRLFPR